jgi:hypothetical protein
LPNRSAIIRVIVLGLIVATDVSLSNLSYLYVTVSFMEMVKSSSPVWVRSQSAHSPPKQKRLLKNLAATDSIN